MILAYAVNAPQKLDKLFEDIAPQKRRPVGDVGPKWWASGQAAGSAGSG